MFRFSETCDKPARRMSGQRQTLGRVDSHRNQMAIAATVTMARKFRAVFS